MEELIKAMSDKDLSELKDKYADNPSIVTLIEGILETRTKAAEDAKAIALRDKVFISAANKILGELPEYSPDWRKHPSTQAVSIVTIEIDDTGQEQVEVEVTNGNGDKTMEMRYPKMLARKVGIGVAVSHQAKTTTTPGTTASKRAINIFKHNPDGADEAFGQFASYQAFADDKGINTGADSARRAIERDGYYGVPITS